MRYPHIVLIAIAAVGIAACSRSTPEPEKKEEAAEQQSTVAEMSIEAQRHVGLEVAPVSEKDLKEYLEVTGTVQPMDSRIAHVRPLARGRIQEITAKVGDRVEKGQSLASFDNIEAGELAAQYESAQAELRRLQVQRATAARQAQRSHRLTGIGAISRKEAEASEGEVKALDAGIEAQQSVAAGISARLKRFGLNYPNVRTYTETTIRAPFAGVVTRVSAAPGDIVPEDTELFQVADLSRVWVQAEVYEQDLARVTTGQKAFIRVETYPDRQFAGNVTYIGDILDPATRTTRVRCEIPNPEIALKLDMFATVRLPTKFSHRALAAPNGAIQQWEGKNFVFVQTGPTKFAAREVQIGKTVDDVTEISSGLRAGEPVVVNGSFHLKSILQSGQMGEE